MSIENKIREILSESIQLSKPIEDIGLEEDLTELGMDSITVIKVIIDIESEYGFEVPDEDLAISNFVNLNNIISYIENRKNISL